MGRYSSAIAVGLASGLAVYFMFPLVMVSAVSATVASLVTVGVYRYLDSRNKADVPTKADPRSVARVVDCRSGCK